MSPAIYPINTLTLAHLSSVITATMILSLLFPLAGCMLILWVCLHLAIYLSKYCRSPIMPQTLGSWAVVTGATDGIGKGFCEELARQGMNIILVSRNMEKLMLVANEIEKNHDVKTKVVDIDFTKDKDAQSRLEAETGQLDIGILVNNVGVSYQHPEYFLNIEDGASQCRAIVDCNIISMMDVTRAVLPGMVARNKGAVINMSSFLAHSGPLLSVYAASKAFVMQFSKDIQLEYKDQGITVMCAAPYYVASNMSKIKKTSWTTPSPTTYSRSVLGQLGLVGVTAGFWSHDIITTAISLLGPLGPEKMLEMLRDVRSRAIRKKERVARAATVQEKID